MAISRKTNNVTGLFFGRKASFLNHVVELAGLGMLRKENFWGKFKDTEAKYVFMATVKITRVIHTGYTILQVNV